MLEKHLFNSYFLTFLCIINIFSLFSNDIKHICLSKNVDIYFDIILLIILLYYIIEMVIFSLLDKLNYYHSFVFWIDMFGILFIIFNIEFITNYIFGYNTINPKKNNSQVEYLSTCLIMLERLFRIVNIIKCLKLYNVIGIKKSLNH